MQGVSDRRARFRTVISLLINGQETLFEGICEGRIIGEKGEIMVLVMILYLYRTVLPLVLRKWIWTGRTGSATGRKPPKNWSHF